MVLPDRIFDAHFHIIDPEFPLIGNHGYEPDPFSVPDYLAETRRMNVTGGAVVSGSFQGFDQSYLCAALARLGPGFAGVTQLPADVGDSEIKRLDEAGVRAVRFNLRRGGSTGIGDLDTLARRVHDITGWHAELYADGADIEALLPTLRALPKLSIDHLGLSTAALAALRPLVAAGAKVKATGFGRISGDIAAILREIDSIDPDALMFGTDLPSTRTRRFAPTDIALVIDTLGEARVPAVFHDNAAKFYGQAAGRTGC